MTQNKQALVALDKICDLIKTGHGGFDKEGYDLTIGSLLGVIRKALEQQEVNDDIEEELSTSMKDAGRRAKEFKYDTSKYVLDPMRGASNDQN